MQEVEAAPDDPDAVFTCSACDARFAVAGSLIAHLRKKHGVTVLMCDLCGLDFEHREELLAHTAAEHPPDELEEEEVSLPALEVLNNLVKRLNS